MTVTDTIKSLETMEVIETETSQKSIEMIAFGDIETRKNSKSMHEKRPTMSFNHAKGVKIVNLNKISNHNDVNIPSPNDNFTKSVTSKPRERSSGRTNGPSPTKIILNYGRRNTVIENQFFNFDHREAKKV